MKRQFNLAILLFTLLILSGCTSQIALNIKESIAHGELNDVTYYTGFSGSPTNERIVIFIRGTGRFDASHDFGMGAEASLFGFSIVYPQKSYVDDEKLYYVHDNRQQRIHDLKVVIEDLFKQGTKKILLLADSEGTMLAPEIASQYSNYICGLVCMGGSISTFEEDLLYTAAQKRNMLAEIKDSDLLVLKINEIYSDPGNVEKDFMGHPYKFWSTYLKYKPCNDLRKLSCPILYLNGENDDLDLIKQKKGVQQLHSEGINIVQKVYPGVGHELKTMKKTLSDDILEWAKSNQIITF